MRVDVPKEPGVSGLPRFLRPLDDLLTVAACSATAMVVLLVAVEVVARYVFSSSIFFANELARLMFVWAIFLGFPLALSRGRHVGIELIDSVASMRVAKFAVRIGALLSSGLLGVMAWKSMEVMLFNWDQRMNTLPLSMGLFYTPIVIGMTVAFLYLLVIVARGTRSLVLAPREDPLD